MKNQNPIRIIYISEFGLLRSLIPGALIPYNIHTIKTAQNYLKIKDDLKDCKPDLLLLEFEFMPSGINSLIKEITKNHPEIKLLILGLYNSLEVANELLKSGAKGYYDQHCPDGTEGIVAVIHKIYKGETVIIPSPYKRISGLEITEFVN